MLKTLNIKALSVINKLPFGEKPPRIFEDLCTFVQKNAEQLEIGETCLHSEISLYESRFSQQSLNVMDRKGFDSQGLVTSYPKFSKKPFDQKAHQTSKSQLHANLRTMVNYNPMR